MRKAQHNKYDHDLVVSILCESFEENKSVRFTIGKDLSGKRMKALMSYAFYLGLSKGVIYINEEDNGSVIIIDELKNERWLYNTYLDLRLLFTCIGFKRLSGVLSRGKMIRELYPKKPFLHLMFIGVFKSSQGNSVGSRMMRFVHERYAKDNVIHLETSTEINFPFYEKLGYQYKGSVDTTGLGYELKIYHLDQIQ